MTGKKKVVVAGGGFAGIRLVRDLDEKYFDILLIDKLNHHQFQPLFYQVATSQIEPSSISFPIRNIFKSKRNVQFRMSEVLAVDPGENKVHTLTGDFEYDYLVIAVGCKTNFFGNAELESKTLTLKTTYDAIAIRNHILQTFESIISATDAEKQALLNLVIVGAGPTGVELAGAFAEIRKHVLPRDYPGIDFSAFRIILIEGSANTLNSMSENSRKASRRYLISMGVTLMTDSIVSSYDGTYLKLKDGGQIQTKTVIWVAGVTGNPIKGLPEQSVVRGNRIKVNRINRVEGCENIFAMGDIAYMETPLYPSGHPQVANVAINQARNLAKNFKRITLGKQAMEFEYKDPGSMATIGRNKAVVDFSWLQFSGYIAWFVWMFLHLMLILSVKNKLIIFINWAWAYVTKDTSLRLILTPSDAKKNRNF
jgi:NADH dehydrogenase